MGNNLIRAWGGGGLRQTGGREIRPVSSHILAIQSHHLEIALYFSDLATLLQSFISEPRWMWLRLVCSEAGWKGKGEIRGEEQEKRPRDSVRHLRSLPNTDREMDRRSMGRISSDDANWQEEEGEKWGGDKTKQNVKQRNKEPGFWLMSVSGLKPQVAATVYCEYIPAPRFLRKWSWDDEASK